MSIAAAERGGTPGEGRVPLRRSWASSIAVAAFVLLCAGWYWHRCWMLEMPSHAPSDFQFYYNAAGYVRHGGSPYLEGGYVYPPLLALLLTPLTAFDYYKARWIWFATSHAAFIGAGFLLWWRLGRGRTALCSIALVWAAAGGAEEGLGIGQLDAALLLLGVAAITGSRLARRIAVAAGFALKFIPGILALLERRWRSLAATGAMAAVLMAAPWAVVRFGLKGPASPGSTQYLAGTPCVLSWGLPSAAVRFADWPGASKKLPEDWTFGYDLPKLQLSGVERTVSLGTALIVLIGGLALFYQCRERASITGGAALLCLAVAASPISWWHYPVLEYPAIAILLIQAVRLRSVGLAAGTVAAGVGGYLAPLGVLKYYFHQQERWPDYPWTIQFWTLVPAFSALILFGLLLYLLRDSRTAHVE